MRVAMFSSESLHSISTGGLGVHVTELAAGLQRRGHDMKEAVVHKAYEVNASNAIVFLGALPRWQYVDLMRACDIVAVPSRNEPFGIVVLEAWAAGKPVVATLAGGPREFTWHDVNGFLVDTNAGGMAHGIGSMLADHDHCRALGNNGRRAVEEEFNWDKVADHTEGVYQVALR